MSEKQLKGKTAVVTGASSGIGRAIAVRFAGAGCRVALMARRIDRLEEIKRQILKASGEAVVIQADLTDPHSLKAAFEEARKQLQSIDILVNNAGTGYFGPFMKTSERQFDEVFSLNVRAVYLAIREVLPGMLNQREGTIINISSIAGKMGLAGAAVYSASKFALMGLSESLLEEVREKNVRVSVICPGMVNTEMFGRPAQGNTAEYIQPEDIAETALLCASGTQTATFKEIVVRPRRPL